MCYRWVVTCRSSQYPSHEMTSAVSLVELPRMLTAQARRSWVKECPVLSLRVSCNDYRNIRPTCEVSLAGWKEGVFWQYIPCDLSK